VSLAYRFIPSKRKKMNSENLISKLNQQQAEEILNRAKALVFAMWQWKGTGVVTSKQLAEYYEVKERTIRTIVENHKIEFESDGSKVLMGADLRELTKFGITTAQRNLRVWTPRAALRLGVLLTKSAVAEQVRGLLLSLVQIQQPQNSNTRSFQQNTFVLNTICEWLAEAQVDSNLITQFKLQKLAVLEPSVKELCESARLLVSSEQPLQSNLYTATDLGLLIAKIHNLLSPPRGEFVNKALMIAGLQTKVLKNWCPSDRGKQYSALVPTVGKHSNKGLTQLKWYETVIPLIEQSFLNSNAPNHAG
jgi:hypothetical protein